MNINIEGYKRVYGNLKVARIVTLVLGLIFLVIGIGVLILGYNYLKEYDRKVNEYVLTIGKVIDYDQHKDDEGDYTYALIIEYEVDGIIYKYKDNMYTSSPISIGEDVEIKYNSDNPKDAIRVSRFQQYFLLLFGGVFTFTGVILTIATIIIKRKNEIIRDENNTNYIDEFKEYQKSL